MKLNLDAWAFAVNALWSSYLENGDVDKFASELRKANLYHAQKFAEAGLKAAGGTSQKAADSAADRAAAFVNSYVEGFAQALRDGNVSEAMGRYRTFLYANAGHALAYTLGQQEAMKERGAHAWRRILHPELSKTGPCEACINDSMLTHSIDEDFQLLHVGDVCSVQEVYYFATEPGETTPESTPLAQLPVPEQFPKVKQMIEDALENLRLKIDGVPQPVREVYRRVRQDWQKYTTGEGVAPSGEDLDWLLRTLAFLWSEAEKRRKEKEEK